ncbi:MAG TPA: metallopeptidase TldD-related protein, partial [Elusimicrobiota bacterium]|nr:metallopeptidase TldD-related protein [Elusimicrobiota bacterium]
MRLALLLAAAAAAAAPSPAPPPDEAVFAPMRAELARSMERLRLEKFPPPYFLSYRVADLDRVSASAAFGASLGVKRERVRTVYVEARSGGRDLDNTSLRYRGEGDLAPLQPEGLRQKLWEETDDAYKESVAGLLEKKARRAVELEPDKLDDFSPAPAAVYSQPERPEPADEAALEAYARRVSEVFKEFPYVYDGRVAVQVYRDRVRLLTSEGASVAQSREPLPVKLYMEAGTRADDGMALAATDLQVLASTRDLPSEEESRARARRLASELATDRKAPLQEPASAPAILDPEFTGVLFHEALGHKLEGQRQRDPDQMNLFKDRVGETIMPGFLSLVDDPTLETFQGKPLHGHYRYDDEGVAARRVVLVDRGVLKGFLMSRWPVKGFALSNGHGRADFLGHPAGRMANLMVVAHRSVARAALKRKLMDLCRAQRKPYGFLLVGASGGENPTTRGSAQTLEVRPRRVFRVDARTGEETPVRGVKLVGTPMTVVNRIVAAGDDATLANGYFCGAESGQVPVDQIAP